LKDGAAGAFSLLAAAMAVAAPVSTAANATRAKKPRRRWVREAVEWVMVESS
jgi:hypothetical protein